MPSPRHPTRLLRTPGRPRSAHLLLVQGLGPWGWMHVRAECTRPACTPALTGCSHSTDRVPWASSASIRQTGASEHLTFPHKAAMATSLGSQLAPPSELGPLATGPPQAGKLAHPSGPGGSSLTDPPAWARPPGPWVSLGLNSPALRQEVLWHRRSGPRGPTLETPTPLQHARLL